MKDAAPHSADDLFVGVCPLCKDRRLIPNDECGLVCSACGYVKDQLLLVGDEDEDTGYNALFDISDLANEETTMLAQFGTRRYVAHDKKLQAMKRYRQRFLDIRRLLDTVARALGMTVGRDGDTERAFFFFKHAKETMGWKFGHLCDQLAIACLFLVSKERHCGFSISKMASNANMEPMRVGQVYRKATKALLDSNTITADHPCFRTETDPWFMLDRLLLIGHRNDSRKVELERLPPAYQTVLGVGMEDAVKIGKLRQIMFLAAKCMALVLDSAQGDSRTPEAMVAACVATAVQIELKAAKVDETFWNVMSDFFYANIRTAWRRRAELRNALQNIASQNPLLARSARLMKHHDKFAYFAEQALAYWEPTNDHLREMVHAFKYPTATTGGNDSNLDDDNSDKLMNIQPEKATIPASSSIDNLNHRQGSDDQKASDGQYPPSFVRAQESRAARARQLQEAQQQLSLNVLASSTPTSTNSALLPSTTAITGNEKLSSAKEQLSALRTQWMIQLLAAKYKTPAELEEAPDSTLEYWVEQINKPRSDQVVRSEEELNSTELSEKDMSNDEVTRYLRPPKEVEAARRVLQPMYDEYEMQRRMKESSKVAYKRAAPKVDADADAGQVKRRNVAQAKASGSGASSYMQPTGAIENTSGKDKSITTPTRPRSKLINWTAVEDLEREDAGSVPEANS
ncbi:hypothetical protein BGW42_000987 [Actinomortierella wolfii]|nr:hypothetical protein BGW42_000987 [Actinomortierella wolfii]